MKIKTRGKAVKKSWGKTHKANQTQLKIGLLHVPAAAAALANPKLTPCDLIKVKNVPPHFSFIFHPFSVSAFHFLGPHGACVGARPLRGTCPGLSWGSCAYVVDTVHCKFLATASRTLICI